jgi:hypothetical protein
VSARLALALLLVGGCTVREVEVVPPEDVGGTCASARENLAKHGGCGVNLDTFEQDCEDKARLYAVVGDRYPVGCLTVSQNCDQARACR